ncbi:DUF1697 domain-containing protein [Rossellomorea aquimaris]|uniref:DUF1697 domain-containing protein n=1 Tax=Rossellomorea aquimaris TaxID=189382 RepID=UPI0007D0AEEB|nr:DUF1697 domain-containing protein [Rossellomorea aquimaris]
MSAYIAFLRGINVGGNNKLKMSELRAMLEKIGFKHPKTYIQSGNALFQSNENEEIVCRRIEKEIESEFGLRIPVVVRSLSEMEQLVKACPFSEKEIKEAGKTAAGESLYVALKNKKLSSLEIDGLHGVKKEGEKLGIVGREVYLLFSQSIRNSKLSNQLQKIEDPVTIRNWKTISKLVDMGRD